MNFGSSASLPFVKDDRCRKPKKRLLRENRYGSMVGAGELALVVTPSSRAGRVAGPRPGGGRCGLPVGR